MSDRSQAAHGQRCRAECTALSAGHLTPLKSPASLALMRDRHKSEREGEKKCVQQKERRGEDGVASIKTRGREARMENRREERRGDRRDEPDYSDG